MGIGMVVWCDSCDDPAPLFKARAVQLIAKYILKYVLRLGVGDSKSELQP